MARVEAGDELTVGNDECIMDEPGAGWPIEMTFDRGARDFNRRRVAGGCGESVDWVTRRMMMVRRAAIGLPGKRMHRWLRHTDAGWA